MVKADDTGGHCQSQRRSRPSTSTPRRTNDSTSTHEQMTAWMTGATSDPASSTTKPAQAELMYVGLTRFYIPCVTNMNNK